MKKFAKILSLALSVIMVASCFIACSKEEPADKQNTEVKVKTTKTADVENGEVKESTKKDDAKEVEKVAEDFFETFQKGDLEGIADFFEEDSDAYDKFFGAFEVADIESFFAGAEDIGLSESDVENILSSTFEKLFSEVDYDIKDIEIDGDEGEVEYEISLPDYSKVNIKLADMKSLIIKSLVELDLNQSEIAKMPKEELIEIIMEPAMENLFDTLIDEAKDADKLEESGTLVFEKIDDEWLIVEDK